MPTLSSTTEFIDLLRQSGIFQTGSLDEALTKVPHLPSDPSRAANVLIQQGLLTRFQARLLLNGRWRGFRLGPYIVLDQLGQGGMGTVFLAEHATLRRRVALKVLNPPRDAADGRMAIERFLREARSAAALDHPNIVRIHDVAQQGNVYYLGLEYVDGDTLDQLLTRGGPITPSRAVGYIAQAAAGLQHAHERGFVHRDIKPANLILTADQKTLKILDMGLARSFTNDEDKLTERLDRGVVTGTIDFISPEQAFGHPGIDIRADIYSLGATFFALITGKPPFEGNTTQKLAQHQLKAAPNLSELDPTLPKGLAVVVAKMLAKKPGDRYRTPAEVITALTPWLGNTRTNIEIRGTPPDAAVTAAGEQTVVDPTYVAVQTVAGTSAPTARKSTRRKKRPKPAEMPEQKKKMLLIAGGAVGVVLAGVIAGLLAFGGGKKPEQSSNTASGTPSTPPPSGSPSQPPAPPASPPRNPTPAPKQPSNPTNPPSNNAKPPSSTTGALLYHVDFASLQPATRSAPAGPKFYSPQIGGQMLPRDWSINHHDATAAVDYLIADVRGARAIGLRHLQGGRTELIGTLNPVFATQDIGESRTFRVTYQYEGTGIVNVAVKLVGEPYTRFVQERLQPTNGEWRQVEFTFTRTDSEAVAFTCNIGPDPNIGGAGGTVWIRSVDVWPSRMAGKPSAAASGAVSSNRYAKWKAGTTVYNLDLSAVAPFRVTKEGYQHLTGTAERLPKGIHAGCWKPTATGEFRCESTDGTRALGLTNLSDERSGQFTFELEKEMNVALSPGKVYRVSIGYKTRNDAAGGLIVQTPEGKGFKNQLLIPLSDTGEMWKTVSSEFERQSGAPIRMNLENFSVGEGNTLFIRSIEVTELTKPD